MPSFSGRSARLAAAGRGLFIRAIDSPPGGATNRRRRGPEPRPTLSTRNGPRMTSRWTGSDLVRPVRCAGHRQMIPRQSRERKDHAQADDPCRPRDADARHRSLCPGAGRATAGGAGGSEAPLRRPPSRSSRSSIPPSCRPTPRRRSTRRCRNPENRSCRRSASSIDATPEVASALKAQGLTSQAVILASIDNAGTLTLVTKKKS